MQSPVAGQITVFDLVVFCIIVAISFLVAKIVGSHLKKNLADRVKKDELEKIIRIVQVIIVLIGIFISLPSFHVDFAELLLIGGAAGVIIGFASQRLVTSIGSGVFLIIERPVTMGDTVKIGDTAGTIEDIRILSTTIKTFEGIYVRIPNETVFNSEITNYVANVARRFEYRVGVRYSDDAEKAIRVIHELLDAHPFVLRNPSPSVYVDELGDNAVIIMVRIWAPSREWWSVRTEMLLKIKTALEKEGMSIPFPQRTLWIKETPQPAPAPPPGQEGAENPPGGQ
ncbi:MAG: mechanosensitive ion channel protein MscS [Methanoregula sp.]|nr:MAG: mechanosensitive ion channel protein MscS [Methanoregula sp.]